MKIEYSATDNPQSVRVAITARTQAFLIASTGVYAVSVTLGPTSFTPDKAPAAAAAVAAMTLTRMRGGTAAGAVTP